MDYKPWMFDDKLWLDGIKKDRWQNQENNKTIHLSWFLARSTEDIIPAKKDYIDFAYAVLLQKETGWN